MIVFKRAQHIIEELAKKRQNGFSVAFLPTMGALHSGHISLLNKAIAPNTIVVSSIFVNPTQFNDAKDFEKYPKTIDQDIYALEKAGCDILFLPSVEEIYPNGFRQNKEYDLGYLDTVLEGAFRPGHYQGVCQVVERLLSIVNPTTLLLGQKDYQQCMVLTKLVSIINMQTKIVIVDTLREKDGLAMSSRNIRLTFQDREKAPMIYQTLVSIKQQIKLGNLNESKKQAFNNLSTQGFKIDYVEIADAHTLQTISEWNGVTSLVILIAAFVSDVRLIDNILV